MNKKISEITKRNITDQIRLKNIIWHGRLSESDFLNRIFDLKKLPSEGSRFSDMEGDLYQHRINSPYDWPDDWIYGDSRLNLLKGEDSIFLQFLCEMVNPIVRNNEKEINEMIKIFNENLKNDGFQIVIKEKISGKPVYKWQKIKKEETFSQIDKLKFEKFLGMESGYVLDFSNATFGDFFLGTIGIDIWEEKYNWGSGSKANRMRTFWSQESNESIGKILLNILEYWKTKKLMDDVEITDSEQKLYEECFRIAEKISGEDVIEPPESEEDNFLKKEFEQITLDKLDINPEVTIVLNQRFNEIQKCLNSKLSLASIFLIGSTLEGILLGVASQNQQLFNESSASPKDKEGKVLHFSKWKLSNFIDVAHNIDFLGLDVKKFSHSLRDFRNYIHPYEQAASKFNPDEHTAKICWQVLNAVINDLSKANKSFQADN